MPAVTKEQIETLARIQLLEIEAGKLRMYLSGVPAQISRIDRHLDEFIHGVDKDQAAIEEFNKRYRALEADVQQNLSKIEKSREKPDLNPLLAGSGSQDLATLVARIFHGIGRGMGICVYRVY